MKLFLPPADTEWLLLGIVFTAISAFIVTAELLRTYFHGSPEITRKIVHIGIGALIFFAPEVFQSGIPAILLAVCFIIVNFVAIRFGLLQGMHGTNRISYGTVYYPMSFLLLVLFFWDSSPNILSISILILAFGDAAAAIVGENLRSAHIYYLTSDKKSIEGSLAMFVVTAVTVFFSLHYFDAGYSSGSIAAISIATAVFVTAWEALSSKGFDNLTVPLSAAFILHYFLVPLPHHLPAQMYTGLLLGVIIAAVSFYFEFLSRSGSVAVLLLATFIYGIGGWDWTVPILTFFVFSSAISKYGKSKKTEYALMFEKSDKRDEGQVAANGGTAGIIIFLWYLFPNNRDLYPIYVASLAAVTADTWGTEIGTLFKTFPRSIVTFKKVPPGTSGGISVAGTAGSFFGILLIAGSASLTGAFHLDPSLIAKIVIAGMGGALIDSLLGATVQAQYQTASGTVTEKSFENETANRLLKGIRIIDNDVVNWSCAVSGGVIMFLLL
ncbi:MAG: DUF92 domain-containing protein [Bacteroidota bacterium]|jgi:uncharacterized protein (TIGR00297 family)